MTIAPKLANEFSNTVRVPTPFAGQRRIAVSRGKESSYFAGISAKGKHKAWKQAWEKSSKEADNGNRQFSVAFTKGGESIFDD